MAPTASTNCEAVRLAARRFVVSPMPNDVSALTVSVVRGAAIVRDLMNGIDRLELWARTRLTPAHARELRLCLEAEGLVVPRGPLDVAKQLRAEAMCPDEGTARIQSLLSEAAGVIEITAVDTRSCADCRFWINHPSNGIAPGLLGRFESNNRSCLHPNRPVPSMLTSADYGCSLFRARGEE